MSYHDRVISGDVTAATDRVPLSSLGSLKISKPFGQQVPHELIYPQFGFPKKRFRGCKVPPNARALRIGQQQRFTFDAIALSKPSRGHRILIRSAAAVMTVPILLLQTTHERLLALTNDISGAIVKLNEEEYSEVIRGLDSVSDAMKSLRLSGSLIPETTEAFDALLTSLETITQEIYDHARQREDAKFEEKEETIQFLKGLERTLNAFARPDEWKKKMVKEWGTA